MHKMKLIDSSENEKKTSSGGKSNAVLPANTYRALIVKSEEAISPFPNVITTDNPQGIVLKVWADVNFKGERYRLFDDIPCTNHSRINDLITSAGQPPIPTGGDFNPQSVLECEITIRTYITQGGKHKIGNYVRALQVGKPDGTVSRLGVSNIEIPF